MKMKTLNEWLKEKGIDELGSQDQWMQQSSDLDLVAQQLEMMVSRVQGLIGDLDEETKTEMLNKFIKSLKG